MTGGCSVRPCDILLPDPSLDPARWAVIACDQYTQEPSYWDKVREYTDGYPTSLDLILPEAYLPADDSRVGRIRACAERFLADGVLSTRVRDGFVYVERMTSTGLRRGLVCAVDLDRYDPSHSWKGSIRASEGVVAERVPPRARIRAGSPVELPHVLMLMNDPDDALFSYLSRRRGDLDVLYDFELPFGGGRVAGRSVEGAERDAVNGILETLEEGCGGLFLAVGDGNHSLAAAKAVREGLREKLAPEEFCVHPSRYALVELCNVYDRSIVFEPIYRILYGVPYSAVLERIPDGCSPGGADLVVMSSGSESGFSVPGLPVKTAQDVADEILACVGGSSVDYIHGIDAIRSLAARGATAILPRVIGKDELFRYVAEYGPLPRKAFSMGNADDKRFYMEARKIV